MLHNPKNCGPLTTILFNNNPTIRNKPGKKWDSLNVDIKTQPVESHIKMVSVYAY